jgi:hypothetical protein
VEGSERAGNDSDGDGDDVGGGGNREGDKVGDSNRNDDAENAIREVKGRVDLMLFMG